MTDRIHVIILIATIWLLLLATIVTIHLLAINVNIIAAVAVMGGVTALVLSVAIGRKFNHKLKINKDKELNSEIETSG